MKLYSVLPQPRVLIAFRNVCQVVATCQRVTSNVLDLCLVRRQAGGHHDWTLEISLVGNSVPLVLRPVGVVENQPLLPDVALCHRIPNLQRLQVHAHYRRT
jgi:hypothetical protein